MIPAPRTRSGAFPAAIDENPAYTQEGRMATAFDNNGGSMTSMILYTGLGLIAFGIAQLVWFVRTDAPRHFAAQAMVFAEMGLAFVVPSVISNRTAATAVVGILGIGVLVSLWLQMKLLRQWRREQGER